MSRSGDKVQRTIYPSFEQTKLRSYAFTAEKRIDRNSFYALCKKVMTSRSNFVLILLLAGCGNVSKGLIAEKIKNAPIKQHRPIQVVDGSLVPEHIQIVKRVLSETVDEQSASPLLFRESILAKRVENDLALEWDHLRLKHGISSKDFLTCIRNCKFRESPLPSKIELTETSLTEFADGTHLLSVSTPVLLGDEHAAIYLSHSVVPLGGGSKLFVLVRNERKNWDIVDIYPLAIY